MPSAAPSPDPELDRLLEELAVGSRVLGANGHEDFVWGHVCARDPRGRGAWLKRSGLGLVEIERQHLMLVSPEGEVVEGEGPRHVEWPIHLEVLAARPDVGAVVHTHPPYAIALGASGRSLQPVSHAGTYFQPPGVPHFTRTAELIVTRADGADVAQTLGCARAALLVNHGIVAVGATVPEAVCVAILLERAAEQQLYVEGLGGAVRWSDDAEALRKRAQLWTPTGMQAMWRYLVRRLEH